jgi:aminomuconate-semialdehyde/2-hydroxymuconate-6-semialdehyde dehydrogenase
VPRHRARLRERPIFDKFVAALKAKAEALTMGLPQTPGASIGPLISAEHKRKVLSYYDKAGPKAPPWSAAAVCRRWRVCWPKGALGAADDLDRPARELGRGARGDLRPCCHIRPSTRSRRRWRWPTTPPTAWRPHLDAEPVHRAPHGARDRGRHVLDQQLVPARPAHRLRRRKQSGIGREGGVHSLEFYTELRNVMVKL